MCSLLLALFFFFLSISFFLVFYFCHCLPLISKPEKSAFALPVTPEPVSTDKGESSWALYSAASNLSRQQLCTLKDRLTFHFKPAFFSF